MDSLSSGFGDHRLLVIYMSAYVHVVNSIFNVLHSDMQVPVLVWVDSVTPSYKHVLYATVLLSIGSVKSEPKSMDE